MKKYGSFILPLLLIVLVFACTFARFSRQDNLWAGSCVDVEMCIILMYVSWLLHEVKVSSADFQHEKKPSDFGTREFYGLGHAFAILSALWFDSLWKRPCSELTDMRIPRGTEKGLYRACCDNTKE